jgi:hypothetical protein
MTSDLRVSADPFWVQLRELLSERYVESDFAVLAQLFTEDTDQWLGIVVTPTLRVFLFIYDRSHREIDGSNFKTWEELTDKTEHSEYQAFADEIACALELSRAVQN